MSTKPISKIKPLINELNNIVPSDFLISNDFDKACIKAGLDEVWQIYKDKAENEYCMIVVGFDMKTLHASEALIMVCNDLFEQSLDDLLFFITLILSSYCKSSNKKIPVKELKECFELIGIDDDKLSKLDEFAKSEFEENLVERDDKKTDVEKIRLLEEKYKKFSSLNVNSHETIDAYHEWYGATLLYLNNLLNEDEDEDFVKFKNLDNGGNGYSLQHNYHEILGIYNLLLEKSVLIQNKDNMIKTEVNKKVFIVHGHDDAMKLDITRFIELLNLKPIILSEQPNNGQTIIEKFESNSNVGYAIVLLSPCDEGWSKDSKQPKPRARQNVIMELGFFIGKLGRANVCALKNGDIELPSDVLGVSYIDYSSKDGGWKMDVAKELKESGYDIDMNLLL